MIAERIPMVIMVVDQDLGCGCGAGISTSRKGPRFLLYLRVILSDQVEILWDFPHQGGLVRVNHVALLSVRSSVRFLCFFWESLGWLFYWFGSSRRRSECGTQSHEVNAAMVAKNLKRTSDIWSDEVNHWTQRASLRRRTDSTAYMRLGMLPKLSSYSR